jgi:uncharacterized protein (DUF2147 family)
MKQYNKRTQWLAAWMLVTLLIVSMEHVYAQKGNADAIVGTWLVGSGKGHVQIYKDKGKYFGKMVWLKEPNDDAGKPKVDKNNPDAKLQSRPIMGLVNLNNFTYDGDNKWEDGTVYDPTKGKEYSCVMTLIDANTLEVRGYVGISLIGRTDTWKRVK